VRDADDPDQDVVIVDRVDDSVLAPAGGPVTLQIESQGPAYPVRIAARVSRVLWNQNALPRAFELMRETYTTMRRVLGPEDPETLDAEHTLQEMRLFDFEGERRHDLDLIAAWG
jgi:hypothetical protein